MIRGAHELARRLCAMRCHVDVDARRAIGGRIEQPDIAAAVVYLAQARSVTGVTIAVDGGQHLAWRTADAAEVEE